MKKTKLVLIGVIMILMGVSGCKQRVISDERIEIKDYKHLKIEEHTDNEQIWQVLLEQCEVKEYPKEEVELLAAELEKQYSYTATPQGKTASELIEEMHGMTSEELAKQQLKKRYAIHLLAKEEGLELTCEEYQKELEVQAQKNGFTTTEEYEVIFSSEELKQRFLEERVLQFLAGNQ